MVTTICYGVKKTWENREDAIHEFCEAMVATAGSAESARYCNVLTNLMLGENVCCDYEEDYHDEL